MTIIQELKDGNIDSVIHRIAGYEKKKLEDLLPLIIAGEIVIPKNKGRSISHPCGIGTGLATKVNANIGTSPEHTNIKTELEKVHVAEKHGADTIMDLSTGGDIPSIRKRILEESSVPIGTVPVYQIAQKYIDSKKALKNITSEEMFDVIEEQAIDGVDFITVHCGITKQVLNVLKHQKRVMSIVSRGGAITARWMLKNDKENPLYEEYDRLLDIAEKYDVTLSLGDGMRPGCLADATDRTQIQELMVLGELADRARARGVQVMVEGPGHIPLNEIRENIVLQKKLCNRAPFYVLGPLVTDVAPGYDHITSAIGGAVASMYGADFLCYVTPTEHLGLPDIHAVREGVVAAKIAAHAGDIAKGVQSAKDWDKHMSEFRRNRDWDKQIEIAIDSEKAASVKSVLSSKNEDICSMCGKYCSMKMIEEVMEE